jgi:glycosyltransferase involved in cell wall biosynthesis
VVCTHNRAGPLGRLLESLSRQALAADQFEVIVVDDGSSDQTGSVCEAWQRKTANLRYVRNGSTMGLAAARNRAIAAASADRIVFTDDDCIARADWVGKMRDALEREPMVAGAVDTPTSNYFQLCHNIMQFSRFMPGQKEGVVRFAAGANMGCRRALLEQMGGFRQVAPQGEDMEFAFRAALQGYRPRLIPDAVVNHDPERRDLTAILRRAVGQGASSVLLRHRYRSLLRTPFVLRSAALLFLGAPLIALKATADTYVGRWRPPRWLATLPTVYLLKLAWCMGAARSLWKADALKEGR